MKITKIFTLLLCMMLFFGSITAQQITTVDPPEGEQGTTLNVTISGQNTHFAQGSQTVYFNQGSSTLWPTYFFPVNDLALQAQFAISYSTPLGYWDVNVYNAFDGHLVKTDGFLVKLNPNQPMIVKADPDTAKQGDFLTVTISGQNTNYFAQGTETVWFTQGSGTTIYPDSVNIISNTQIDADFTIPMFAALGYYNVNTFDLIDGYLTKADGFRILPYSVSLKELDEFVDYEIFPNPIINSLFVKINPIQKTSISISIFDICGRTIFSMGEKAISSLYIKEIDFSNIRKGTYFVRISAGTLSETRIVIKE